MKKISVVVPMYYEEDVAEKCYMELKKVLKGLKKYSYELIFVNDGSKDRTLEILEDISKKDTNAKVVSLSRNFGHQAAVSAGLMCVTGDVVVIIDADLQDPPKYIPEMLKLWENGYEVIYGKRKKRNGETFLKLFTAKIFYRLLNSLSFVKIPMDTGDFRLVDRKVVDVINSLPEHNKFLRGLFSFVGFKQIEFLYEREERYAGKTKYGIKKMFRLALDGLIGFSYKPLQFILVTSLLLFMFSFISLIVLVVKTIILNTLDYIIPLIIFLFSFNTGLLLFCMWILGLYISRICDEVRNRPSYIIDKKINFKE